MEPQLSAPVAVWFAERIYWVFLGLMLLNVIQRKHQKKAGKKRMATLLLGVALFVLLAVAQTINHFGGTDMLFYLAILAFAAVVFAYRDKMWPFRFRSAVDGRWLTTNEILFDDNHGDGPSGGGPDSNDPPGDDGHI